MFRKIILIAVVGLLGAALVYGAVNRTLAREAQAVESQTGAGRTADGTAANGQGSRYGAGGANSAAGAAASGAILPGSSTLNQDAAALEVHSAVLPPASDVSQAEIDALLYMREEEKLAQDVYLALYDQWGAQVFSNIASSEAQHTQAVLELIQRYELPDPALAEAGKFTNPDLQALYDQLVAQGADSLEAALRVGAAVEEIDILDLEERLAATDSADLQQVFNSLLSGSESHLRAFVQNLERQFNLVYQPQYLSLERYQAILGGANGRGQGGQGGQGGRDQGRGRGG